MWWGRQLLFLGSALVGSICLWHLAAHFFGDRLCILVGPRDVWVELLSGRARLLEHTIVTACEMGVALILAFVLALPLALCMLRARYARTLLQSGFVITKSIPLFVLAPIIVTCFGWSYISILIPTTLMLLFPLTISLFKGLSCTPQEQIDLLRVHHATPLQILWKLRLPYARPHIFSGLRIAAGLAGTGAIAGEMAGAQVGLGVYLTECRHNFEIEGLYLAMIALLLLGLSFYGCFCLLEKQFVRGSLYAAHLDQ